MTRKEDEKTPSLADEKGRPARAGIQNYNMDTIMSMTQGAPSSPQPSGRIEYTEGQFTKNGKPLELVHSERIRKLLENDGSVEPVTEEWLQAVREQGNLATHFMKQNGVKPDPDEMYRDKKK